MKICAFWLLILSQIMYCGHLRSQTLTANNDVASTLPNLPVTIAVLTNDVTIASNQTAILRVTQPMHGTVIINPGQSSNAVLSQLFQFAAIQLSNSVVQIADTNLFPWFTDTNGVWNTGPVDDGNWITGFFPGLLWLIYEHTGDTNYRAWAEAWMSAIELEQFSTNTDDVGFMINTSYGNAYRLTGNSNYQAVMLQTAQSFSARFNPFVGCLADDLLLDTDTNPPPFQVIMDTMMNAELLYAARDLGGSSNFYNMAASHAGRTLTNQIRSDGSTFHMVIYNATNGAVLLQSNRIGLPQPDTWARGHSWAIHGFTTAYRETGDTRFLNAAKQTADYYLAQVPADYVPYWYFQTNGLPPSPPVRDSSAAAVTLSALVELSQLSTNASDGAKYWQAALDIFNSLRSTNYLAQGTASSGILLHGDSVDTLTDTTLIYGDYYFVEALKRFNDLFGQTTLTYVPDANFTGVDQFTYQACDNSGNTSSATVSVTVGLPAPTINVSSGHPTITFPTAAGGSYFVQYANNLNVPILWNALATNIAGTGSPCSITDTNTVTQRFYRLGVQY